MTGSADLRKVCMPSSFTNSKGIPALKSRDSVSIILSIKVTATNTLRPILFLVTVNHRAIEMPTPEGSKML